MTVAIDEYYRVIVDPGGLAMVDRSVSVRTSIADPV